MTASIPTLDIARLDSVHGGFKGYSIDRMVSAGNLYAGASATLGAGIGGLIGFKVGGLQGAFKGATIGATSGSLAGWIGGAAVDGWFQSQEHHGSKPNPK